MMSAGIIFLLSNQSFMLKNKYPSTTCKSEAFNALNNTESPELLNVWY